MGSLLNTIGQSIVIPDMVEIQRALFECLTEMLTFTA